MTRTGNFKHSDEERRLAAVQVRAYLLWEADGRPEGRDVEYWARAEREVTMDDLPEPREVAAPQARATEGSGNEVSAKGKGLRQAGPRAPRARRASGSEKSKKSAKQGSTVQRTGRTRTATAETEHRATE
jgi:hypothetical protein